mmetsp:Transcript_2324/g.8264  ORF Transcript_2324/g.8264 Transcript_2324/m.8264 type:complete len:987 (+) Transcript_2324:169-3129(+)|eukprot:CAMPEP_0114614876 /NCGR_PEP_ID=MMETSP0168-20121206/5878_1 /TAXON_ID=95228 ORGANISM="Vannella sp., Strain DIVA3 517/6/12" /NCGR_SAMPLE_ID=MMETSP0168 /ASSEMBLY_ACC=CAM_ASM_000044 /LENGTH=986 /DNA_ID=CAMNT_0001825935 /DNA_START=91 /DNA_END=3051 /DNA_ORIENTATION=-
MSAPWASEVDEVLAQYSVQAGKGLTEAKVEENRAKYGRNETASEESTPLWKLVLAQFDDQLVKILLGAAVISFVLALFEDNEDQLTAFVEPLVIGLILIANAIVGVLQETNAEKAIEALKSYVPKTATVIRNGKIDTVDAAELVPGDIVEVAVGHNVPADLRVIELRSVTFRVDQAVLTGESVSVAKVVDVVPDDRAVNQDKINMLFAGTNVTIGRARGLVTGTGASTEFGKIRKDIEDMDEVTSPLQKKLDDFGELLSKVILVICILVWLININHFNDPEHGGLFRGAVYYFKIAVALAVAAIPEGLPAVVTTCLALGTMKMAKNNAIVRSLPSVETLGCTTVICSDKTGTLTTNQMSVCHVAVVGDQSRGRASLEEFAVSGTTYKPTGVLTDAETGEEIDAASNQSLLELSKVCSLCSDARVNFKQDTGKYESIGEPTEVALRVLVEKVADATVESGVSEADRTEYCNRQLEGQYEKLATLEFSRDRKSMSTLVRDKDSGEHFFFVKGAPEAVLSRCKDMFVASTGSVVALNRTSMNTIQEAQLRMSERALRVLAIARISGAKPLSKYDFSDPARFVDYEQNMTFIGLVGMLDPPRMEVADAIKTCRQAGIRVIVITGDNKVTAEAICRKIGVFGEHEDVAGLSYTGREFEDLSHEQQLEAVSRASLFSRTEPTHKSQLVELLQSQGEVVAMTGDGVNDAPALKKADIGIGMGSGTAVAKGASDMVLADDNFATIVSAVKEGRGIYNNTKQFIRYLISSNIGEVACIFLTAALGMPEALIPVQLLWVNLVTDGLPATALGFNKPDKDIMKQRPRGQDDAIINGWMFFRYMAIGLYIGIATVGSFWYWFCMFEGGPQITWEQLVSHYSCHGEVRPGLPCTIFDDFRPSTVSLSVLVTIEMFNAFNSLSENQSLLQMPFWSNSLLVGGVVLSFLLHFVIVYIPVFAGIFSVAPISWAEWKIVLWTSAPIIVIDELFKLVNRTFSKR